MAFPKPLRSKPWAALGQIAEHWAPDLDGYDAGDLAHHLLVAAENGDVPAEFVNVIFDLRTYYVADIGGLRGFFERRAADGFSRGELFDSMLRGGPVGLALHRDGVLAFAAQNEFSAPSWWSPATVALPAQKSDAAKRRPGPDREVRERVKAEMRAFIGRESLNALREMKVAAMAAMFGASRDTCRNSLSELLEENSDSSRQIPNNDK